MPVSQAPRRPINRRQREPVRQERDRILITFSPELGRRLRDLAARERRPISAQLELLLERALAASEGAA